MPNPPLRLRSFSYHSIPFRTFSYFFIPFHTVFPIIPFHTFSHLFIHFQILSCHFIPRFWARPAFPSHHIFSYYELNFIPFHILSLPSGCPPTNETPCVGAPESAWSRLGALGIGEGGEGTRRGNGAGKGKRAARGKGQGCVKRFGF